MNAGTESSSSHVAMAVLCPITVVVSPLLGVTALGVKIASPLGVLGRGGVWGGGRELMWAGLRDILLWHKDSMSEDVKVGSA